MARGSHALQSLSGDLQRSQPVFPPTLQEQRGNDALQSLSDDLISQEKASLPDSGSPTKTPGVVQQAQEKTAGALDYVEKQSQPQAGVKVRTEVDFRGQRLGSISAGAAYTLPICCVHCRPQPAGQSPCCPVPFAEKQAQLQTGDKVHSQSQAALSHLEQGPARVGTCCSFRAQGRSHGKQQRVR